MALSQAGSEPDEKVPPAPRRNTIRAASAPCRVSKASFSARAVSPLTALVGPTPLITTVTTPLEPERTSIRASISGETTFSTKGSAIGLGMRGSLALCTA